MSWSCAAIDNGVTIYENGQISPCCMIDHTYRKDITTLRNAPFSDLHGNTAPVVCARCTTNEANNLPSYRQMFNTRKTSAAGLQFVDIRNSNVCNLKCRTCTPDNSNQWANELGQVIPIRRQSIVDYKDIIITDSINQIYYTGGEPFLDVEHWDLLACVDNIATLYKNPNKLNQLRSQIKNNSNKQFFRDTLLHVLLLDKIRNEKLFDLLPFKQEASRLAFANI